MHKFLPAILISIYFISPCWAQDSETDAEKASEENLDETLDEAGKETAESKPAPEKKVEITDQFETTKNPDPLPYPTDVNGRKKATNASSSYSEPRLFGRYDIMLGFHKPTFTTTQDTYEKFYGKNANYYSMSVDYYVFDGWVAAGVGFRSGIFYHSGKTSSKGSTADSAEIIDNSSANLLMAPVDLLLKLQTTPFRKKWVRLSAWGGYERLFWRESKTLPADDQPTATSSGPSSLTTGGTKDAIVLGTGLHLSLNWLDEATVHSMNDSLGLGAVYLTLFYENIKQRESAGFDFSRNVLGFGFSFETLH